MAKIGSLCFCVRFQRAAERKGQRDKRDGGKPREREGVKQRFGRRVRAEYHHDSDDAERAGAHHHIRRGEYGAPRPAQNARRNFVQAAHRFKKQDAQNAHARAFDLRRIAGKQPAEKVPEHDRRHDHHQTAEHGKAETEP